MNTNDKINKLERALEKGAAPTCHAKKISPTTFMSESYLGNNRQQVSFWRISGD